MTIGNYKEGLENWVLDCANRCRSSEDPYAFRQMVSSWKELTGQTDYEIGQFLGGVSPGTVSNWRHGRTAPSRHMKLRVSAWVIDEVLIMKGYKSWDLSIRQEIDNARKLCDEMNKKYGLTNQDKSDSEEG